MFLEQYVSTSAVLTISSGNESVICTFILMGVLYWCTEWICFVAHLAMTLTFIHAEKYRNY